MVYRGLSHHLWDISNYQKRCWLSRNLTSSSISNINIFKTLSHSIVNNNIFWKCVAKPFRCIYVNWFNILRFFCWSQHKIEKMHFFRQFKDHNSVKKNENYKSGPIFSSTFSALPARNIHFWIWKYLKFIFNFIILVYSCL